MLVMFNLKIIYIMEKETIEVRIVGLGRKLGDSSTLDSYLYYFEDDYFEEKIYPDAFDNEKVINVVDVDRHEDIEFPGFEDYGSLEYEFEIEVDQEILDNIKTAKDFYRSYITKINVFGVFSDAYWLVSSFELADGNVISLI